MIIAVTILTTERLLFPISATLATVIKSSDQSKFILISFNPQIISDELMAIAAIALRHPVVTFVFHQRC